METFPQKINWRITSSCDMVPRCCFCYAPLNLNISPLMHLKICDKIIDANVKIVGITGGEPACCNDLLDILKYLSNNGVDISLSTNGNNILTKHPNFYRYIKIIALPIDYSNIMRPENNLQAVINLLEFIKVHKLKEFGLKIKIETVASIYNYNEIDNILKLTEEYDVDVWKIFEYINYEDKNNPPGFNNKIYLKFLNKLNKKNTKCKIICEDTSSRNNRYFIINPNGNIIIPTMQKNGRFKDVLVGSIFDKTDKIMNEWYKLIDYDKYKNHLQFTYKNTYKIIK